MRMRPVLCGILATAGLALAAPGAGLGAEPPNQNDPCASGGRNTCGTEGVGTYERYRYGLRWFGDFRGAVEGLGRAATFCIDLRFWYPGRQYRYREIGTDGLRNRDGRAVSAERLARMSYAIWNHGRGSAVTGQAATMLYVHSLMGDGAPGEVDPGALGPAVSAAYARIERDAARLRGPYRIRVDLPDRLGVAARARGTVRVLSAEGNAVPGVRLRLRAAGTEGLAPQVTTDGTGVAAFGFTPASAGTLRLDVASEPLAAATPRLFAPSTAAAARNGQRLAAARSETVEAQVSRPVARATPRITTRALPARRPAGGAGRDRVTLAGVGPGYRARAAVLVHGPFRTREEIVCTGEPAVRGTLALAGTRATTTTAPDRLDRPGWYAYQLVVPPADGYDGLTTPCAEPSETFRVEARPALSSRVDPERLRPGGALRTTVTVTGLAGERVPVAVELFGPFASREDIACTGTPLATETLDAAGDGTYATAPVTPEVPGFYVYRERIAATDLVRAAEIPCGDPAETAIVVGAPQVVTEISDRTTRPGARITDRVIVSGLGRLRATVNVELWGPYPTREAMTCTGTPRWTGTLTAEGDGTYTTAPVTLDRAGFYTYRETIAEAPQNDAAATRCGEESETTFTLAEPTVTTLASAEVVRPGSAIFDRVRVRGLGRTPAEVDLRLYGPFPTRDAIRCTGDPLWRGRIAVTGDGEYRSAPVRVARAGFYTYRERLIGRPGVTGTEGECALVAETSLAAPAINTGRGDPPAAAPRAAQDPGTVAPARIRIAALGVDAPVGAVGIDTATGALAVPANIRRTAWWRDGAAPGDRAGAVLIAGHVDSARAGAGAFFRLKDARGGQRVEVTGADGRTRAYRVVSVRTYAKARLPVDVYSRRGPARLVLVTCGGPFDAGAGVYRDNVVLTARPV